MPGGGGGGDDVLLRSPAPAGGGRQQRHPRWLPLDVVAAIAARSAPATLVRCAATTRASSPATLRDTDRFVLPLLRGHLTTGPTGYHDRLSMLDTATADGTRFVGIGFPPAPDDDDMPAEGIEPLDSRGGLLLVRLTGRGELHRALRVCDLATDRSQALPSEPASDHWAPQNVHYVLLVGDGESGGAVGRSFRVLKTNLVLTKHNSPQRRLQIQIFSSELGAWGPLTEIPTPNLHGSGSSRHANPLVVGDVVHWLCLTHTGSYVLMLRVGAARVTVITLPASFPRAAAVPHARPGSSSHVQYSYLLATTSAGGSPIVLVANDERISAWPQSTHTKIWKQRPWVVIAKEAILRFDDKRSGAVLFRISKCGFFWLDLQSMKIVRRFPNPRSERTKVPCSYEMCLSSWVPTFSRSTL
ncbi:hypothetical protein GQ55_2G465900 [Panicum hallii var. hallii]|uniref:DUF7595 domain-containing protein n=1 Tax=Panicum hallii var. hallii TaxID=1504633 RepID=A0A2T7EZR9_9POAL|nr:hypothetical protein GQ55_2G465900 [Panicum hallii var. hallii]